MHKNISNRRRTFDSRTRDNYYVVSLKSFSYDIFSNTRGEGRYIGLTQAKDREAGNRVFRSLVGRAPKSIRGSRPNYAATRRLRCTLQQFAGNDRGAVERVRR